MSKTTWSPDRLNIRGCFAFLYLGKSCFARAGRPHVSLTWSIMATDVIVSEDVSNQRDLSDMNANKTNPEFDTPNRTFETLENRHISSPSSSSVYSGEEISENYIEGDSEQNGDSPIQTGDPPQEVATPDNGQKQGVKTSTPVRPQTIFSSAEHNGR